MYAYEMRKSKRGVVKKQFSLLFYFALFCFSTVHVLYMACMCVYCEQQPSVYIVPLLLLLLFMLENENKHLNITFTYFCAIGSLSSRIRRYTLFKYKAGTQVGVKKRKYNFYFQNNTFTHTVYREKTLGDHYMYEGMRTKQFLIYFFLYIFLYDLNARKI